MDRTILDRLLVPDDEALVALEMDRVDWLESDGNYVRLHVNGDSYALRSTLKELEDRLDPETFLRIHRSVIVNVDRIQRIRPLQYGDLAVVLENGTELRLARSRRGELSRRFGGAL